MISLPEEYFCMNKLISNQEFFGSYLEDSGIEFKTVFEKMIIFILILFEACDWENRFKGVIFWFESG